MVRAILNLLVSVMAGAASLTSQAETQSAVRYVFKGTVPILNTALPLRPMTLGLNAKQVRGILALTSGRVNFGDLYFIDRPAAQIATMRAQPNFSGAIYANVPPPDEAPVKTEIGDPEWTNQWWIEQLHVKAAWAMATGKGVTIADCDSGIYYQEKDLNANVLVDLRYDVSDSDDPYTVDDGGFTYHGTAVAAIMVGVLDGMGTNGIAYNAKLVPLQNFNYDKTKDKLDKEEATAKCVLHAIATPNVKIIVLENQTENGSSETFVATRDAVRLAVQSGITVVGAGGNYSEELKEEAKDDTGSVIVGALTKDDQMASFSNFGARVSIAAYGEKLHTLYGPNGVFGNFGGTSGATPQVAATLALMMEVNPMLSPQQARDILETTRVVVSGNENVGGRLDSFKAVQAAKDMAGDIPAWSRGLMFRQELVAILLQK